MHIRIDRLIFAGQRIYIKYYRIRLITEFKIKLKLPYLK